MLQRLVNCMITDCIAVTFVVMLPLKSSSLGKLQWESQAFFLGLQMAALVMVCFSKLCSHSVFMTTIGVDFKYKRVVVDDKVCKLQVWYNFSANFLT